MLQYKFLGINSNIGAHKQDVRCLKKNSLWRDNVLRFWILPCHHISCVCTWGTLCLSCCSSHGRGRCSCLMLALGKGSRTGWSLVMPGMCRAAPARQRPFPGLVQQWPNCCPVDVVPAWRWQSWRGWAQPAAPHPLSCSKASAALRNIYF